MSSNRLGWGSGSRWPASREARRASQEQERLLDERTRQDNESLREAAEELRDVAEEARHSRRSRGRTDEARRVADLARETQADLKALLTEVLAELRRRGTPTTDPFDDARSPEKYRPGPARKGSVDGITADEV
jgi:hypothetical protein